MRTLTLNFYKKYMQDQGLKTTKNKLLQIHK